MATQNPYGLSYVRTLGSSSAVFADGITPFTFGTGFSGWMGDVAAIDVTQTQTVAIPEYVLNGGTTTTFLPTIGVFDSFLYTAQTQYGNQTTPAVNYLLTTPIQSGSSVTANVITDPMAIYKIQSDSATGLASTAMFKYFAIGAGLGSTLYATTNADYSALTNVFVNGDQSSTGVSKMCLLSATQSNTYNNNAANSVLVRVIGLADGEVWYDASNPSTASSYNSVLVQLVNSALVKPGS